MSRRHVEVPRDRFTMAVRHVIERGEYPSGSRINKELARGGRYLSPVECQWRREVADAADFTLNGSNLDPKREGKRRPPMRVNGGDAFR